MLSRKHTREGIEVKIKSEKNQFEVQNTNSFTVFWGRDNFVQSQ